MLKEINVSYWMGVKPSDSIISHNSIFTYSKEKRDQIVDYFLDLGYEVMLRKFKEYQIILVDLPGGRFRQR